MKTVKVVGDKTVEVVEDKTVKLVKKEGTILDQIVRYEYNKMLNIGLRLTLDLVSTSLVFVT